MRTKILAGLLLVVVGALLLFQLLHAPKQEEECKLPKCMIIRYWLPEQKQPAYKKPAYKKPEWNI